MNKKRSSLIFGAAFGVLPRLGLHLGVRILKTRTCSVSPERLSPIA